MWLNVPHGASDDFIRSLAQLVKNDLRPDLNLYLEYSNETWNYTFSNNNIQSQGNGQLDYVQRRAVELGLPGSNDDYRGQSYYVYRALQVFRIFEEAFGSSSSRLRRVLAYSGNEDVALRSLDVVDSSVWNPAAIQPDIFAVAPYVGNNATVTTESASEEFRKQVDLSVGDSNGYVRKFKRVVDDYNLRHSRNELSFSTYEAGQHFVMGNGSQKAFNDNPWAFDDYMYMLNAMKPYFGTFMQFVHVAKCDENDCWGAKAHYGQVAYMAPKSRAVNDFQMDNACVAR